MSLPTQLTEPLTLPVKFLLKLWNSLISNTNKQPVTHIPFDLMVEILCRLPVKSLLRFRCVCKSWNSLISNDRSFAKKQLNMSTTKHNHLITTTWNIGPSSKELDVISYPLDSLQLNSIFTSDATVSFDYSSVKEFYFHPLIGSCDGLLCFTINKSLVVIWNPLTRKLKELPSLQIPPEDVCRTTSAFGFNSFAGNDDLAIYAFGYDPFIDNYKVVSVFCYDREYVDVCFKRCKTIVKVHTLGTNSWRRIKDFPSTISPGGAQSGIIVNGSVYWLAYSSVTDSFSCTIVSLDLGKEFYQEISHPDYGMSVKLTMGVMWDCLCIFSYSNSFTDVWLMKEYKNKDSWIKLVRLPIFGDHGNYYVDNPRIVYISKDDNHVLLLFKEFPKLKWLVYDAKNKTKKSIKIQDFRLVDSTVYVESLVSP